MRATTNGNGHRVLAFSKREQAALLRAEEVLMQALHRLEDRFAELGSDEPVLDAAEWNETLTQAKASLGGVGDTIDWPEAL